MGSLLLVKGWVVVMVLMLLLSFVCIVYVYCRKEIIGVLVVSWYLFANTR